MVLFDSNETRLLDALREFHYLYPDEQACLRQLYLTMFPSGRHCPHCGDLIVDRQICRRVQHCVKCGHSTSFTTGTFFHRVRRLKEWCAAIFLFERGLTVSSAQLQRILGLSYDAAWNMFHKLTMVISAQMSGAPEIPTSALISVVSRRTRLTPAGMHPHVEEEQLCVSAQPTDGASCAPLDAEECLSACRPQANDEIDRRVLTVEEKSILDVLSDKPAHFDEIYARTGLDVGVLSATLTILELDGILTCLPGDWFTLKTKSASEDVTQKRALAEAPFAKNVEGIIRFLRLRFFGVSRKYLQHFLAAHWWCAGSGERILLQACLQHQAVTRADIAAYVSPALVMAHVN